MIQDRWHGEHWVSRDPDPVIGWFTASLKKDDWVGIYGTCAPDVDSKKEGRFMKWWRGLKRLFEMEDRLKDWTDTFGTRMQRVEHDLKRVEHSLEWTNRPAASLVYIPTAELRRLHEEMKQLEWRIRAFEEEDL